MGSIDPVSAVIGMVGLIVAAATFVLHGVTLRTRAIIAGSCLAASVIGIAVVWMVFGNVSTGGSTPTSPPVASAPSTSAESPKSSPESALPYKADWARGLGGWVGSDDWTAVRGQLVNNGMGQGTAASITAPVRIDSGTDYAVDAQIQLVRNSDGGAISGMASFGVVVRAHSTGGGYGAGRCVAAGIFSCGGPDSSSAVLWTSENASGLDAAAFEPGHEVHRYRLEVRGTKLTALIDGAPLLTAVDNAFTREGRIGLWSDRAQITVLSFEVSAI